MFHIVIIDDRIVNRVVSALNQKYQRIVVMES